MKYVGIIPLVLACSGEHVLEKRENIAPTIVIASHADGVELLSGYSIPFRATVSDDDNEFSELSVAWYVGEEEVCEATPASAAGESLCDIVFNETDTNVIAEVRDEQGAGGRSEIEVFVLPTEAPVVELLYPLAEQTYYTGQLIQFSALVSDEEDAPEDLLISWTSSVDGPLALDTWINSSGEISDYTDELSEGQHAIELRVEDLSGKVSTAEVVIVVGAENNLPTCGITEPQDEDVLVVGEAITFRGFALDEDIPATDLSISWNSNLDGPLGISSANSTGDIIFSYTGLSIGEHVISLDVQDEIGGACNDTILLSIGNPPSVSIDGPTDGEVYSVGALVNFEGAISDLEDQPANIEVEWRSSINGSLNIGSANAQGRSQFSTSSLNAGLHSIDLLATDSTGLQSSASISLRVNTPPVVDAIQLSPDPITASDTLTVQTTVSDQDGDIVTPSYQWYENGTLTAFTGTTISSAELDAGEEWTVRVTPNDGYTDGPYLEASIAITNNPPTATIELPAGDDVFALGEMISFQGSASDPEDDSTDLQIEWSSSIDEVLQTGQADAQGSSQFSSSSLSAGLHSLSFTVTDSVGASASDVVSFRVNSPPEISDVAISSSDGADIFENSTLTCTATASDADETVSESYAWTVNGVDYEGATLDLSTISVETGDEIICTVSVEDSFEGTAQDSASTAVTGLSNEPPFFTIEAFIEANPMGARIEFPLFCIAEASDPEDGEISPEDIEFNWTKEGSSQSLVTGPEYFIDPVRDQVGDVLICTATATDSNGQSTSSTSEGVSIENSPPIVEEITLKQNGVPIEPDTAIYNDSNLSCSAEAFDPNELTAPNIEITYAWRQNSSTFAQGSNIDLEDYTILPFDEIKCVATAKDPSYPEDSGFAESEVTIANRAPEINSATLSNTEPEITDTITCSADGSDPDGENITINYEWFLDEQQLSDTDGWINYDPVEKVSSLNLDLLGPVVGSTIRCSITAVDRFNEASDPTDRVAFVQNSPPTVGLPEITSDGNITVDSFLSCSAAVDDINEILQESSIAYRWTNSRLVGITLGEEQTLQLDSGIAEPGDAITCTVTATDDGGAEASNSNSVSIDNTPPVFDTEASIASGESNIAYTGENISCSGAATDPDGGPVALSYAWYIGDTEIATGASYTVDASETDVGDTITCTITATDQGYGTETSSAMITIGNSNLSISTVEISSDSGSFYNNEVLTCSGTITDVDDDATITYSWSDDSQELASGASIDLSTQSLLPGDELSCTIDVDDGEYSDSASTTIPIGNRGGPSTPTVQISPNDPLTDEDLTCVGTAEDVDGEPVSYTYDWTSDTGKSFTNHGPVLESVQTAMDEEWTCTVTASSGSDTAQASTSVTIVDLPVWSNCPDTQTIVGAEHQLFGTGQETRLGYSVATAGDVDNDGFDDILMGAPGNVLTPGASPEPGHAYLMPGRLLNSSTINVLGEAYVFEGENTDHSFGKVVQSAGDVDNDGLEDILVSAPHFNGILDDIGRVYLFLGSGIQSFPTGAPRLANLAEYSFSGVDQEDHVGTSIASGDIDGDGRSDIVIGYYADTAGLSNVDAGSVAVFLGKNLDAIGTKYTIDQADYTFTGAWAGDKAGHSVSVGHVDGDNLADILIGAPERNNSGTDMGSTYLLLGSTIQAYFETSSTNSMSLSEADYEFTGESTSDRLGSSVAITEDIDGDGWGEILTGAYNHGSSYQGAAYLIYSSALSNTLSSEVATAAEYIFTGMQSYSLAGKYLSSAGDVDGDSIGDLLIGANGESISSRFGRAHLILGGNLPLGGGTIDLSTADYTFEGEMTGTKLGTGVASAGDIDGDGMDEILIGEPEHDDSESASTHAGRVGLFDACQ